MAFDAGVFAQANKPTVALEDPNTVMGKAAAVQNALNANRQFQATEAAGRAFQGAIDPTTGLLSQNRLGVALSQLPGSAAIAVQPALQQGAANQGQNLGNAATDQGIKVRQSNFIGQALGAVLDLPDAQLHDGVVQAVMRAKSAGLIDDAGALKLMGNFPADPAQLRTRLRQVQLGLQPPDSQQGQIFGAPATQDDGGTIRNGVQASPARGGGFAAGSVTPKTVTPGEAVAPQTRYDAQGQPITAPGSAFMPSAAVPAQLRPQGPGAGRYPTPVVPGAGGSPVLGPAPGVAATNEADTKQYRADLEAVPSAQQNVQNLQKAQHALEIATTGVGTESVSRMLGFINTVSPETAKAIAGKDQATQYDLAHKYLIDYARKSGAAANSDLQLRAAEGANANTANITNQAALDVVKTNIGRERQRIAQAQAFGNPNGVGYGQHASSFASGTDPRAFAWDTYTPAERQKIEKGMDSQALAKLDRSLAVAARLKLIQVPGAQ